MSKGLDGGRNALAGFLYQVVVDCGLTASALLQESGASSNLGSDADLDYLLSLAGTGQIDSEVYDVDAVLSGLGFDGKTEKCVLIQYKYSNSGAVIKPKELEDEILDNLIKGADQIEEIGGIVTDFALVTNRPLSLVSSEIFELVRANHSKDDFRKDSLDKFEKLDIRKKSILKKLLVPDYSLMSPDDWNERFDEFCLQYGAMDDEIERTKNIITGQYFRRVGTGQNNTIHRRLLVENLVGNKDVKPLLPKYVRNVSFSELNKHYNNLPLPHEPLRRDIWNLINRAIAEEKALVVLYGNGGCGKTITLIKWCLENVENTPPNSSAVFTHTARAKEVDKFFLAKIVSSWMHLPEGQDLYKRNAEEHSHALSRLDRANPELQRPIFYLGLDGLDERAGFRTPNLVTEMISWFIEKAEGARDKGFPPPATLIGYFHISPRKV